MPSGDRKKRRRLVVAAFTANGLGAMAGLAVHAAFPDPLASALAGAVVSGTVGDVLRQLVAGAAAPRRLDHLGEFRLELESCEYGSEDPEGVPGELAGPGDSETSGSRCTPSTPRAVHESPSGVRRGYARCIHDGGQAVPPSPSPSFGSAKVPAHPRHRHLHRSAQRFVRRARVGQPSEGGHAAS